MNRNWRGKDKGQQNVDISFYWQHYGLSQDPFSMIPDNGMYYLLPRWEHYLDLLQHLIKTKNVLLSVTGAEGCGKSAFAQHFMQQTSEAMYLHLFTADSMFSTRKLVRELEQGFNLKAPINEAPEDQLDAQITAVQYSDKTCLLVIDDAHFLPLETLNSLLFLLKQQSSHQMRLHILLFGDRNLQTKLVNLAKNEMVGNFVHDIELPALTLAETKEYLEFRLQKAGLLGALPFSQMQIEQIYAQAEGYPAAINHHAQQVLLYDLSKKQSYNKPTFMYKHQTKIIGGLLVVGILVGASYMLNKESQYSITPQKPVIAIADSNKSVNLPTPTSLVNSTQSSSDDAIVSSPQQTVAPESQVEDQIATAPTPEQLPATGPSTTADTHQTSATGSDKSIRLASLEKVEGTTTQRDTTHRNVISQPQIAKKYGQQEFGPDKNTVTSSRPAVKAKAKHVKKTIHHALSSHDLKYAHKREYTIQLIGLSHKTSVKNFISKYDLEKKATYYQMTLKNKPFYVIVYGEYNNRHAADAAIKTLPSSLHRFNPYVRSFASVQQDMNKS